MHPLLQLTEPPAPHGEPVEHVGLRELQLELQRVRASANAARLEARAAEIELLMQRLGQSAPLRSPTNALPFPAEIVPPPRALPDQPLPSWNSMLSAARRLKGESPLQKEQETIALSPDSGKTDTGKTDTGRSEAKEFSGEPVAKHPVASREESHREEDGVKRRSKRAAWGVSLVAHGSLLVVLALMSVAVQQPRDQLSLAAAVVAEDEPTVEALVLEQTEVSESNEELSQEETVEVADVVESLSQATDAVRESLTIDQLVPRPSMSSPLAASSLSQAVSGATAESLATTFFGASGGGNHFVYLVDNSGSMDDVAPDGFDLARNEVLRAVDSLREDQRFYVIFFGEQTLPMQLGPGGDTPSHSVYATAENKLSLRSWAMSLGMQSGKWPEEALELAFELRPDCIFLLTDGAMPARVESFIAERNLIDNLFDGPQPRSIVHTIGFHNESGGAQLRSIAAANGGTYHFVPARGR